jgi:hypothetical protein
MLMRAMRFVVVGIALALLAIGCDDPPPDLNAGRLQIIPGDAGGGELVATDAASNAPDAASVEDSGLDGANADATESVDSPDEDAIFVIATDARSDAR